MRFCDERVIRAYVRDRSITEEYRASGPYLVVRNDLAPQCDEPHAVVLTLMAYIFRSRGRRIKGGRLRGELVDVMFRVRIGDAEEEEQSSGHYDGERAYGDSVARGAAPEGEEQHGRERRPEDRRDLSCQGEEPEELPELLGRR